MLNEEVTVATNACGGAQQIPVTGTETPSSPVAATPAFSPQAGTYITAQTVTITDAIRGAAIYCTTNGATPTATSAKYGGAIEVSATRTIQAIAVAASYTNSAAGGRALERPPAGSAQRPKGGQAARSQVLDLPAAVVAQ